MPITEQHTKDIGVNPHWSGVERYRLCQREPELSILVSIGKISLAYGAQRKNRLSLNLSPWQGMRTCFRVISNFPQMIISTLNPITITKGDSIDILHALGENPINRGAPTVRC